jgi:hypothetical protein
MPALLIALPCYLCDRSSSSPHHTGGHHGLRQEPAKCVTLYHIKPLNGFPLIVDTAVQQSLDVDHMRLQRWLPTLWRVWSKSASRSASTRWPFRSTICLSGS